MTPEEIKERCIAESDNPAKTLIYMALGEASVSSWSETPSGIFETEKVSEIGDSLLVNLQKIGVLA